MSSDITKERSGFSLVEMLVTLTIIGVISILTVTCLLENQPNKELVKFQKTDDGLVSALEDMVKNNKYFYSVNSYITDFGLKPNGDNINSAKYFCKSLADTLVTKDFYCSGSTAVEDYSAYAKYVEATSSTDAKTWDNKDFAQFLDNMCYTSEANGDIVTTDVAKPSKSNNKADVINVHNGSTIFIINPGYHFGKKYSDGKRVFSIYADKYKYVCLDTDGITTTCNDKDKICPYGYGVSASGKIIPGARAKILEQANKNSKDDIKTLLAIPLPKSIRIGGAIPSGDEADTVERVEAGSLPNLVCSVANCQANGCSAENYCATCNAPYQPVTGKCVCKSPFKLNSSGACVCQDGRKTASGTTCVCDSARGFVNGADGTCVCNSGYLQDKNASGQDVCVCPTTSLRHVVGNQCVCVEHAQEGSIGCGCIDGYHANSAHTGCDIDS